MRYYLTKAFSVSPEVLFKWLSHPKAFERLNPPWESVSLSEAHPGLSEGSMVKLQIKPVPKVKIPWVMQHHKVTPPWGFEDHQVIGPFAFWKHWHQIKAGHSHQHSLLQDEIEYSLPFGWLTNGLGQFFVSAKLNKLFNYRERILNQDFDLFEKYTKGKPPMKILVTGATGLVGKALTAFLETQGHEVIELRRGHAGDEPHKKVVLWDPVINQLNPTHLEGIDAVVHLAGENIAEGRWDELKKKKIVESRVQGTKLLCEALAQLKSKPKVLVSASAIGYYGDRADALLSENDGAGHADDFLAQTCIQWEAAAQPARDAGIRVVHPRIGIVLSSKGAALKKMLLPFLIGAGGTLGMTGSQFWSWIAIDDVIGGIYHALQTESLEGPVNLVAPNPVTNKTFTNVLAKVLFRPALAPVPGFMLKLILGEMAQYLLLGSTRVSSQKLQASGYNFQYPELEGALRHQLGK